jgi:UTP-glucose-1-phosphate uridylyltransferase
MLSKVIIPVAGLGTCVLPASKAIPKEMLPVVDKPVIKHVVEEAMRAGFFRLCWSRAQVRRRERFILTLTMNLNRFSR